MYEFGEKEHKTVNRLFYLAVIYILLSILQTPDWYAIFEKAASRDFETFSAIENAANIGFNIIRSIIAILFFFFIKKLRETDKTKRLYGIVFWVITAHTIFSYLYTGMFYFSHLLPPDIMQTMRDRQWLMSAINSIYLYSGILLPLPFYIAILVKEKRDINWMAIGGLMNIYWFLREKLLYWIRDYMRSDIRYMTGPSFEQRFPLVSVYINYDILVAIRNYFWIIGIFIIIFLYKKRYREHKAKQSG